MPNLKAQGDVKFFYADSGALEHADDTMTIILIHGNGFNGGVFERLFPLAKQRGLRIIAINRRLYSGSTPYSDEELCALQSGSEKETANFLDQQGVYLALFVDAVVRELQLPQKSVTIAGWSLGCAFLTYLLGAINQVDDECRKRLADHVKSIIFWDPAPSFFGFPTPKDSYSPLFDASIPLEQKGLRFSSWISSYFTHKDLQHRNAAVLNYRVPDPDKHASVSSIPSCVIEPMAGIRGDNAIPTRIGPIWSHLLRERLRRALLDPSLRESWGNPKFSCMWGDKNSWVVPFAIWEIEDLFKTVEDSRVSMNWKIISGGNHLVMWDDPEHALSVLEECIV